MGGWVDFDMVRYISLLLFIGLAFWSCDDENDNNENNTTLSGLDTIPPSIQILSPLDADILTDNTIIDVEDKGSLIITETYNAILNKNNEIKDTLFLLNTLDKTMILSSS